MNEILGVLKMKNISTSDTTFAESNVHLRCERTDNDAIMAKL